MAGKLAVLNRSWPRYPELAGTAGAFLDKKILRHIIVLLSIFKPNRQ